MSTGRINWVDYSKGICIILFVMTQSVWGLGSFVQADSWAVFLAKCVEPFALPTLFLLSGLFLKRTLFGSKSTFFDRKLLRFVYFYILWLLIHTLVLHGGGALRNPLVILEVFLSGMVQPSAGLWIIPLLAIFHVTTWTLRFVKPAKIIAGAAFLQVVAAFGVIETGWLIFDRFVEFYIFFFAGYAGAEIVFRYAKGLSQGFADVPMALLIWAVINTTLSFQGTAQLPLISLITGFAGAFAVIAISIQLIQSNRGGFLAYAGRYHLVIYLTYFLPMTAAQMFFINSEIVFDAGLAGMATALFAILLPLSLHRLVRHTPAMAIYRRPKMFRLKEARLEQSGRLLSKPHTPVTKI